MEYSPVGRPICKNCGSLKREHVRGSLKCKTRLKETVYQEWTNAEWVKAVETGLCLSDRPLHKCGYTTTT